MDTSVSVAELHARLRRAYGSLESYADEGEQESRNTPSEKDQPSRWTTVRRFRTRWRRPSWLYFAFESVHAFDGVGQHSTLSVIWSTPNEIREWASYDAASTRKKSLVDALYAFQGTSGGLTGFVPRLLAGLPSSIDNMQSMTDVIVERRDLDGAACLVARLGSASDKAREFWVDATTHLLVRVDSVAQIRQGLSQEVYQARLRSLLAGELDGELPADQIEGLIEEIRPLAANPTSRDFTSESVTRYRSTINPELDDIDFEFVPPSE